MADHIGVRIIDYQNVKLAAFDCFHDLIGDLRRAHLRLQIIGSNPWRRDQNALLTGEFGLNAAVEEKGNVGIFFRFSYPQITQAVLGHYVGQNHLKMDRAESDREWQLFVELGHAGELYVLALAREALEIWLGERHRQLAGPVRPEVEEYDAISVADRRQRIPIWAG